MRTLLLCAIGLTLVACSTTSVPQNEGAPAGVAEVVGKIKADLATYQDYDAKASTEPALPNACKGIVGFYIDNVKVSLTTQRDDTISTSGSLTLPVGSATFGPSLGASHEIKGTQTLTFALYPKVLPPSKTKERLEIIDANEFPIAASLQRLRNGLLVASKEEPCVALIPLPDPATGKVTDTGGTFAFGFTVIKQVSTGGTLKFVVFSLGATNTAQRQAGNSITVTFKARQGSVAAQ
jgi:hypothetical protein